MKIKQCRFLSSSVFYQSICLDCHVSELGILEKEEDSDRIRPKYLSNPRGHQKTVSWLAGYALKVTQRIYFSRVGNIPNVF